MNTQRSAVLAYAAAAGHRGFRQQEADVFRHASALLRRGQQSGPLAQARAVADNDRLWTLVLDLVRDPANALPEKLRAGIASIGLVVQRELRARSPDLDFIAAVNESIARGLSGPL